MSYVLILLAACFSMVLSGPCNPTICVLPNCRCANDPAPPGNLGLSNIPQIIMVTTYGTINRENIEYYEPIYKGITNPNGCPVRGTHFVQDQDSDYGIVRTMFEQGHEIGIHSENGIAPNTPAGWIQMFKTVLDKLSQFGIDEKSVYGVRVPELAEGGTGEFIGIGNVGLQYDSSCSNVQLSNKYTMVWPYTLDYDGPTCDNGQAPELPFPGKWEVPIADLHDLSPSALPCIVPSACGNITTKKDAYDVFFNAFLDHYQGKKAPFNMIVDPAWAKNDNFRDGTIEFLQYVRAAYGVNRGDSSVIQYNTIQYILFDYIQNDVWIIPIHKTLQWIQDPTPIANLSSFKPWAC